MLKELFKRESIEANPQKAVEKFNSSNSYHKELAEVTIRSELSEERGSTLEQVFRKATCCTVSDFRELPGSFKRELFGALQVFTERGLVEMRKNQSGEPLYYFTKSGANEANWKGHDLHFLKEMVREYPTLFYS